MKEFWKLIIAVILLVGAVTLCSGQTTRRLAGPLLFMDADYREIATASTASFTVLKSHNTIRADATSNNVTLNLPTATGNTGLCYKVIVDNVSTNKVIIDPNGGELINGVATVEYTHETVVDLICDGSGWKTAVAETRGVVTPLDFGAVGDGVADDTTAVQNAVDTGYCLIPAGYEFLITSALTVSENDTVMILDGVITQGTADENVIECVSFDRFDIHGAGELRGEGTEPTGGDSTKANGIYLSDCEQTKIRGIKINDWGFHGIQIRNSRSTTITGVHTWGSDSTNASATDVATWGSSVGVVINGGQFLSQCSQNIFFQPLAGDDQATINGVRCGHKLDDGVTDRIWVVDILSGTDIDYGTDTITYTIGHHFQDDDLVRYESNGHTVIGGLSDEGQYYIINRTDTTFQLSATQGGGAIDLTDNADPQTHSFGDDTARGRRNVLIGYLGSPDANINCVVTGVICNNSKWDGIGCQSDSKGVLIQGCNVNRCGLFPPVTSTGFGGGIGVQGASRVQIIGCQIADCGPTGQSLNTTGTIALTGSNDSLVAHNAIAKGSVAGIFIGTSSTRNSFLYNTIDRPDADAIHFGVNTDSDLSNRVVGNHIVMDKRWDGIEFESEGATHQSIIHENFIKQTFGDFDAAADVDTAADTIDVTDHNYASNESVWYLAGGNTAVGGLAELTQYYVILDTGDKIKLSATSGPGAAVDLTATSSGTHGIKPLATADNRAIFINESTPVRDNYSVQNNVCEGWTTAVYFQPYITANPRNEFLIMGPNRYRYCMNGIMIRALNSSDKWLIDPGNTFEDVVRPLVADAGVSASEYGRRDWENRWILRSDNAPTGGEDSYAAGDLAWNRSPQNGAELYWYYDGTAWLEHFPKNRGHLSGFPVSINSSDTFHDIDIGPGATRNTVNSETMTLTTTLRKQIDAAWAQGTNQGGLDTGAVTSNVWYHCNIIEKNGAVDWCFSLSETGAPATWDFVRRVFSVRTNGSSDLEQFTYDEKNGVVLWDTPVLDFSSTNPGTDFTIPLDYVPEDQIVKPLYTFTWRDPTHTGTRYGLIKQHDTATVTPSSTKYNVLLEDEFGEGDPDVVTNDSGQIGCELSASDADTDVEVVIYGYIEPRDN